LHGITRKTVLEIAQKIMKVEERDIMVDELSVTQEAFITGTTKRVLPVSAIDHHLINQGQPGPVTRRLMALFTEYEQSRIS
jgi:branched-subunit amino acid aminotransferase/4-amino-4-deoxychorismate lyase